MRSLTLPVSLLFALGCGGESTRTERRSDEPGTDTQGGRRLEAVFVESADGIGVFRHFYDTELELNCNFELAENDAWHCLPIAAEAPRVYEIVYTDAECTEVHAPLLTSSQGLEVCTPPRYTVVSDSCGANPSVFELGSPSSTDSWYRVVDGVCALSTTGSDYLRTLYAVTPVLLEEFQAARLHVGDEISGIVPVDLRSDDGASVRLGFRDALEGFDCRLGGTAEDSRCVPRYAGYIGYVFADPGCTRPAALGTACSEEWTEMPFAHDGSVYHRGGARLPTSYGSSPELCVERVNSAAFEVGAEVPITRFAAGAIRTLAGGDLEVTVDSVGTASLLAHTLRSTAHGGYTCNIVHGVDGELRCMPPSESFSDGFFADAGCTERVESYQGDVLALEVPFVCPPQVGVYAIGERHTGPVYAVTEGVCALAFDRPPNDSERSPHYAYPNEIPATEFTRLFEVVR